MEKIRLALPSKGRLQEDTLALLKACDLSVHKPNARQYIASLKPMPQVEIWFQRPADIVRHVRDGNVALGIAGFDTLSEYRGAPDQITIIHDALGFGHCTLEVIVPEAWQDVNHIDDLVARARAAKNPLRLVSKFERCATRFLNEHNLTPYQHLRADGALEAAPNMNTADFIVDLVQTGLTLQENRLKQIDGGRILESQACLFGNTAMLKNNPDVLTVTRQLLERFEAHLRAKHRYNIIANVRGDSPEAVATKLHQFPALCGLQGPTISPVYPPQLDEHGWHAISLVVPKRDLQTAIQQLRSIGGSGVVVLPALFIYDEEPARWRALKIALGLNE